MNYYSHHIGDFIRDTARLSDSQSMIYLRLLWMYYESEQPLTDNLKVLTLKVGGSQEDVLLILQAFFKLDSGVWRHTRCDKEIDSYQRMSQGGKIGAAKRWSKGSDSPPMPPPYPPQCTPNANQEPRTKNHISKPDGLDNKRAPRFDAFRHLVSLGVPESIANDWIALRKAKKAAPTATAIQGIHREADKAGMLLADALALCCQRGWQGFKAEWVVQSLAGRIQTVSDKRAAAVAYLTGKSTTDEKVIQGEVTRVA